MFSVCRDWIFCITWMNAMLHLIEAVKFRTYCVALNGGNFSYP